MKRKRKGKSAVRHDLDKDVEYKGLDAEAAEFLEQFNNEWNYGTRYSKDGYVISDDEEYKAECERNNNRNKRDLFDVKQRSGMLDELTEQQEFMEAASDDWDWQNVYKMLGKNEAVHVIFEQAKRDLASGGVDPDIVLSRFMVKILRLKTITRRERDDIPKKKRN